ncbi:MAG: hypothetical protein U5K71_09790 [Gracilimonas sp.]|nr:hypothetical protein [Gracilimonas sp.]
MQRIISLAGKSLPWWAIGASLIAANISAETDHRNVRLRVCRWTCHRLLRMDGRHHPDHCAVKYLLPIFIEKKLYTIPEFIEHRYNTTLENYSGCFLDRLFVFVNLTTVMFLGAKALDTIMGTGRRQSGYLCRS